MKVLLATDLSAASELATDLAFGLAASTGGPLVVVSVIEPGDLRLPGGRVGVRVDQVRDQREGAAQGLVERGRRSNVPVTFLVWEGDPGESIVSAAEAEEAELIVVGTHGRGRIGRLVLGSVSDYVVRNGPCPVLVAHPRRHGTAAAHTG